MKNALMSITLLVLSISMITMLLCGSVAAA